jgi:uncharacterized protein
MAVTQEHIDKAIELAKEYGATKVLLFGSALTDPKNANDLDIGVEGITGIEFFEFGGMLENILNTSVDIIDLSVNERFLNYINSIGKLIYNSSGKVN